MPDAHTGNRLFAQLLVFDLDGTLIDSRQDLSASVNATLSHLSRPALSPERVSAFIGDGAKTLVQRSLEATGGSDEIVLARAMSFFLAHYREHKLDQTYVYDGVLSALGIIHAAAPGVGMAILTNKPGRPAREICEALHLSGYFFAIYGGDSFATKKPDPAGLLRVIDEAEQHTGLTIEPANVVMVGDSEIDVATARSAGTRCLGCTYGFSPEALLAANPDFVVSSPTEWVSTLQFPGDRTNGIL